MPSNPADAPRGDPRPQPVSNPHKLRDELTSYIWENIGPFDQFVANGLLNRINAIRDAAASPAGGADTPSYESIKREIETAPITWVPALLIAIVQRATRDKVFVDGGLQRIVEQAERRPAAPGPEGQDRTTTR